jgi:class 3 adenylate cyclase
MDYEALLTEVLALLQREQRLAYCVLKLRLQLDDDTLEALKEDLIYAKQLAVDEEGKVLVWTGGPATSSAPGVSPAVATPAPRPDAERRQLTVLFCDLADSTALAERLDLEELRDVVRTYQRTCEAVISRFDGRIAQYLGDGLLVYFGYPVAHEDDARRAVHAGLGMLEALEQLNRHLAQKRRLTLAARLGIHTGVVVVGEMGGRDRQEQLALGEGPNVAARRQGLAAPNTVVLSAATHRLVHGFFTYHDLGLFPIKGLSVPLQVYRVLGESGAQSRFEVTSASGLTPLVGREQEVDQLLDCWRQAKQGMSQVVLLSGEAGIGKSRLVQAVKDHAAREPHIRLECRCSPYSGSHLGVLR